MKKKALLDIFSDLKYVGDTLLKEQSAIFNNRRIFVKIKA